MRDAAGNITGYVKTEDQSDGTNGTNIVENFDANWLYHVGTVTNENGTTTTTPPVLMTLNGYQAGDPIDLTEFINGSTDILHGLDFNQNSTVTTRSVYADTIVRVDLDGVVDATPDFVGIRLVGFAGEIGAGDFIVA